eukprot:TRINITY_DN32917_c0_g1_i1.p1 TRINITY_DN32917_c0_g1~~TRINITY_DN32917_c0_g1_i1.p1  ORF type:complete len:411 (+),score=111.24 TRINITY_DN32917_c0_g1_i1:90-1322(+)
MNAPEFGPMVSERFVERSATGTSVSLLGNDGGTGMTVARRREALQKVMEYKVRTQEREGLEVQVRGLQTNIEQMRDTALRDKHAINMQRKRARRDQAWLEVQMGAAERGAARYQQAAHVEMNAHNTLVQRANESQARLAALASDAAYRAAVSNAPRADLRRAAEEYGPAWEALTWQQRSEALAALPPLPKKPPPKCVVEVRCATTPGTVLRLLAPAAYYVGLVHDTKIVAGITCPPVAVVEVVDASDPALAGETISMSEGYLRYYSQAWAASHPQEAAAAALMARAADGGPWEPRRFADLAHGVAGKASCLAAVAVVSERFPFLTGHYHPTPEGGVYVHAATGYSLFTDPHGRWKIGAAQELSRGYGLVKSADPHHGAPPYAVRAWLRVGAGDEPPWVPDSELLLQPVWA